MFLFCGYGDILRAYWTRSSLSYSVSLSCSSAQHRGLCIEGLGQSNDTLVFNRKSRKLFFEECVLVSESEAWLDRECEKQRALTGGKGGRKVFWDLPDIFQLFLTLSLKPPLRRDSKGDDHHQISFSLLLKVRTNKGGVEEVLTCASEDTEIHFTFM